MLRNRRLRTDGASSDVSRLIWFLAGLCLVLSGACAGAGGRRAASASDGDREGEPSRARGHGLRGTSPVDRVEVMFPGERMPCAFEALGVVNVRGPFLPGSADAPNAADELLEGIRAKVGKAAANQHADAALVRRFLYDHGQPASAGPGEILGVEAVLVGFVDPECEAPIE